MKSAWETERERLEHVKGYWLAKGLSIRIANYLAGLEIENLDVLKLRYHELSPAAANFGKKSQQEFKEFLMREGIYKAPEPKRIPLHKRADLPSDVFAFCWTKKRGYFVSLPEIGEIDTDPAGSMPEAWSVMLGCLPQSGDHEWIRQQIRRFLDESE